VIAVLGAALLWGFSGALASRLMDGALPPDVLIPLRFLGSLLLLLPVALHYRPPRGELPRLLALGVVLSMTLASYYLAIAAASVATALFLQYLAPALLTLYALLKREALSKRSLTGVALAVPGAYFLVVGPEGLVGGAAGLAWGLASAFCFAAYAQLSSALRANPWTVLFFGMAAGSALSLPLADWRGVAALGPRDWGFVLFVVSLGTVLPFGLFLWGVRQVSARLGTLLATLEPVSGTLFAALIAAEPLLPNALLGGALILLGVGLNTARAAPAPTPPP